MICVKETGVENVNEDRKIRMPHRYEKRVGIGPEGVKSGIFRIVETRVCFME